MDQQVAPSAKCTDGTFDSSITPEILLQACQDGTIGEMYTCYGETCGTYPVSTDGNFLRGNQLQHVISHVLCLHCMLTKTTYMLSGTFMMKRSFMLCIICAHNMCMSVCTTIGCAQQLAQLMAC